MALKPDTHLGAYRFLGPLGAGGMGEVWRARDTSKAIPRSRRVSPGNCSRHVVSGLTDARTHYAVTAGGQRFLVVTSVEDATSSPITFVLNWTAELKK